VRWGHIALPRIGQEVIVEFLEGDPDQTIITGRTYHATNQPPYRLPHHKTRMTIQSKTHKGNGFNELRFEDEKDEEEVYLRAQKDLGVRILNNAIHHISDSEVKEVTKSKYNHIGKDYEMTVTGSYSLTVGHKPPYRSFVGMLELKDDGLQRGDILDTSAFMENDVDGYSLNVAGAISGHSGKSTLFTAEQELTLTAGNNLNVTAQKSATIDAELDTLLHARENALVNAGNTVKLVVPGAQIVMTKEGRIRIKAADLEIDVGGKIIMASQVEMLLKSMLIKLN